MGVMHPELVMRNMIPVVMAGVLGIYGLIVAVILNGKMSATQYGLFDGYAHLAAGLSCGLSGLGAGMAIGIVGDSGTRANAQEKGLPVFHCHRQFRWPYQHQDQKDHRKDQQ